MLGDRRIAVLNFTDKADGDSFTDRDLEALTRVQGLVRDGVLDDELAVSVTRAMGHNAARLVEWLYDALVEHLVDEGLEVEAAAGRSFPVGVFDLARSVPTATAVERVDVGGMSSGWRLTRVAD